MTTDQSKCQKCDSPEKSTRFVGQKFGPCNDPWHDTPADSAPVAGNTGSSATTSAAETVAKQDVLEPAAGGGDTPDSWDIEEKSISYTSAEAARNAAIIYNDLSKQLDDALRQRDEALKSIQCLTLERDAGNKTVIELIEERDEAIKKISELGRENALLLKDAEILSIEKGQAREDAASWERVAESFKHENRDLRDAIEKSRIVLSIVAAEKE